MKDETRIWVRYAEENMASSEILFKSYLYNPCLQNVQQCIEKFLKAILVEKSITIQRTHDILKLKYLLLENGITIEISDDECDFMNSIYLPSKYPLGSVLADFDPDKEICFQAIEIAKRVMATARQILQF